MRIGIIGNTTKEKTPEAIRQLVPLLKSRGIEVLLQQRLSCFKGLEELAPFAPREAMPTLCDAVIAFGGDGTMLSTGRFLAGTGLPLIGFNLGKLGFLAEFPLDEMEETIDDFLSGRCVEVERSLICASIKRERTAEEAEDSQTELIGLNDIVLDKRDTRLMVTLEVSVDGHYLGTYEADGLIIATPTGSTAYALAVGGPVVTPDSNVVVVAPIAPHMLTARPVVLPDRASISIVPVAGDSKDEQSIHVIADGQNHRYVPLPAKITISRYRHSLKLVKRPTTTYFDVLRAKLLWGRTPALDG